jgi:hypothetical protein
MTAEPYLRFPKIGRLFREIVITEKLDGVNALVYVSESGEIRAGSRSRWITTDVDMHGFARWVQEQAAELLTLGPGRHWGEWWGSGIGRRYGLQEKRFSLFNVHRWETGRPECCHVVPVIARGIFSDILVKDAADRLRSEGSLAAPGFMDPEGLIVFHTKAGVLFKFTLDGDAHKVR